jgi:transcriptional regulator with XRE-family HTH domain
MTSTELKEARRLAGWTQARLAKRLEVTQAYVSFLEKGRRRMPVALARQVARLLDLPPTSLPLPDIEEVSRPTTNEWVEQSLARLGHPGYAHRVDELHRLQESLEPCRLAR